MGKRLEGMAPGWLSVWEGQVFTIMLSIMFPHLYKKGEDVYLITAEMK